jgi:hypothetical protein
MKPVMADQCIYPGPHGAMSEEHYLPAALGKFQGYEPLRGRVCRPCNTHIGDAVETEFLRTGAIVFFRWMVGVSGRDGLPPSPFYRRAAAMPPILMVGRAPGVDYDLLFEVEPGTENVYPLRQVVFEHRLLPQPRAVPIYDRMRDDPQVLAELLREWGLDRGQPIRGFAAPDEIPWLSGLLQTLGYTVPTNWAVTSFPAQKIQLIAEVTVSPAHFRAVAKIGFHYALKMFPNLTGMEREFDAIKDFIWAGGGDEASFVKQRSDQFVKNFERARPTKWMHILAVERAYDAILAHAQFFAGPDSLPPPYLIRTGRDPARIMRVKEAHAHQFVILDPPAGTGEMVDAAPAQLIWTP